LALAVLVQEILLIAVLWVPTLFYFPQVVAHPQVILLLQAAVAAVAAQVTSLGLMEALAVGVEGLPLPQTLVA
jgi:hypothetical protein